MTGDPDAAPALGELLQAVTSRWRIDDRSQLQAAPASFSPPRDETKSSSTSFKRRLNKTRERIKKLQGPLYAGKQYSLLLIFQALDAAGKDGAIREVFEGLDPAGLSVASFKRPTPRELAHDFLWRTTAALPERGCITAFNRSYYEEVLTVRVHPEFLRAQYGGAGYDADALWPARYRAIREHERHLATANTVVLKFWLNVSPQRQALRFMERIEDPSKSWKFSSRDVVESGLRERYDEAVMHMLNETSRPWAPWFCVPADDRWYLREQIADVLLQTLSLLPLHYPAAELPEAKERGEMMRWLQKRMESGH